MAIISDYLHKYREIIQRFEDHYIVERIRYTLLRWLPRSGISRYVRILISTVMESLLLLAVVYVICVMLLYLSYMMWGLYQQTLVGERFLYTFPERAAAINEIMELDFWYFAGDITLSAFMICIGVSVIGWFLPVNRFFYLSRGFFGKIICWGLPLTGLVAFYIWDTFGFTSLDAMFIVAIVPTCCMFMSCFNYTEKLIPEFGEITSFMKSQGQLLIAYIKPKDRLK